MCRSIKILRQPAQTAAEEEVRAAALQFIRKISGTRKPSRADQAAFDLGGRTLRKPVFGCSNDEAKNDDPQAPIAWGSGINLELARIGPGGGGPDPDYCRLLIRMPPLLRPAPPLQPSCGWLASFRQEAGDQTS